MGTNPVFRFGDFELHPASRTVLRGEKKLTLNRRAFDVLYVLVQHPGEVLSREQLLKSIWNDSFVDENSLSQSISTLRRALAEKAGDNSYIATLPGRGYQFVAVVSQVPPVSAEPSAPGSPGQRQQEPSPGTSALSNRAMPATAGKTGLPLSRVLLSASIAALLAVATVAGIRLRHRAAASTYRHIVLADFANTTGDPALDLVFRKAIEIDLAQSPYMDVLSAHAAADTLRFMGRPPDTQLTAEVAREVCERTNNDVLLNGSVSALGRHYLLTVEATACTTGKMLAVAKATAQDREQLLDALDSVAAQVRKALNESSASVHEHDIPLREATTSSLEALKAYSVARMLTDAGGPHADRIAAYQRAVALDPQFALAFRGLSAENTYIGQEALAAQYALRAYQLSQHVSTRERLLIQASYDQLSQRDILAAIQDWSLLAATYPQDSTGVIDGMDAYMQLGQHQSAIQLGTEGLQRFPNAVVIDENLATSYLNLSRFAEAQAAAQKAAQIGPGDTGLHVQLFLIALARHDEAALAREVQWLELQETGSTVWFYPSMRGTAAATAGRLAQAELLFRRAYESAVRADAAEAADHVLLDQARTEMESGLADRARATLLRIRRPQSHTLDVLLLQAQLGDPSPARRFLARGAGQASPDTLRTYVYLPELRAVIALHDHEPGKALDALAHSTPYEMRDYTVASLRAEAYQQARRPAEAAAEYSKILSNPGVDPLSILYPLAHLGLARAYEMQGQHQASHAEYQALLTLWKNADPDLPILKVATMEQARLPRQ